MKGIFMNTENKMGVMPIKQLIITMSLPMMISMLVQALYNVVDSIFVARISENALTAVTLAFPMQNLMIALGSGTGVGINALLSRSLGEKKFESSDGAANTGLLLTFFNLNHLNSIINKILKPLNHLNSLINKPNPHYLHNFIINKRKPLYLLNYLINKFNLLNQQLN